MSVAETSRPCRAVIAALLSLVLLAAGASEAGAKTKHGVRAAVSHRTLVVVGNARGNKVTLRLKRRARNTLQVDVGSNRSADFSFNRRRFTKIRVLGGKGNDALRIDERNGVFTTTERTRLEGQGGNDVLAGGAGRETLVGGAGRDTVDGNGGNDVALLGAGDDTFLFDAGDGSDRVDGQAGTDRLLVNGSRAADTIGVTSTGTRLRVTGGGTTDAGGFERVAVNARGGADALAVDDVAAGGVRQVDLALGAGDGQPDGVTVNATAVPDTIGVSGAGASANVTGLSAPVSISQAEPGRDRLAINTLGGADQIDATGLAAGAIALALDGGDDTDRLALAGSSGGDSFGIARNGARLQVLREGSLAVDADHLERLDLDAGGGPDAISVGDMAGTALQQLGLALGGASGDGQPDSVIAAAGDGADQIAVTGGPAVNVAGLAAALAITQSGPGDRLTVDGRGGADTIDATGLAAGVIGLTLRGGPDADVLTGSPGDDRFESAPGDGSDTVDGKGGIDTAAMEGSSADETFSAAPNGARLTLLRGPDAGSVDATGVETIAIDALGGADTVTVSDLTGTAVTQTDLDLGLAGVGDGQADSATVDGTANADNVRLAGGGGSVNLTGLASALSISHAEPATDRLTVNVLAGTDTVDASNLPADSIGLVLNGGDQADTLIGSAGGDSVVGGRDNDVAFLGGGDDTFTWNPGDGSDTIEGQGGSDRMLFNGANIAEHIDLSANGTRLRFTRDVAAITMDANGVERVDFNALGGADTITVGDLTGTDVTQTNIDLGAVGGVGDGAADNVIVNGTANPDSVSISGGAAGVTATGLQTAVSIAHSETALDTLTVNSLAGTDTVNASGLSAGAIGLTLNGGDQADTLIGSGGNDLVVGGRDNDVAFLGGGDDTFTWNPGDGSDTIEGQGGSDRMLFNGANIAEHIDLSANGTRLRFTRDVATITMDANGVERVDFNALGGADTITVGDLTGTDVTQTNIDLGAVGGVGDGAADNVIVNGTGGDDVVSVAGGGGSLAVDGLRSQVNVVHAEPANDRLTVNLGAGADVANASGLAADAIALTMFGGDGDDVLIGGSGDDILHGDANDDTLIGGPGTDVLDGGTGNNTLIQ